MVSTTPRIDSLDSAQNLQINGNVDIWQRGTSISVSNAAASYLADRIQYLPSGSTATGTVTQSTVVPTLAQSGSNSRYSLLLTTTNQVVSPGASAQVALGSKLEGQDYQVIHGKPGRYQFWARSSVTGLYSLTFANSALDRIYVATYTINAANTYELKYVDLTFDTLGTWLFDTGIGLRVYVNLQSGSSGTTATLNQWQAAAGAVLGAAGQTNLWAGTAGQTFYISQLMLVPGSFASDAELKFRRASKTIADELSICQRYCYGIGPNGASAAPYGMGSASSTTNAFIAVQFPVTMRIRPTFTASGVAADYTLSDFNTGATVTVLPATAASRGNVNMFWLTAGAAGLTQFRPYSLEASAGGGGFVFDAEL